MGSKLENKLSKLPVTPGIYFYKDSSGEIIYVGKAARLRSRVRQYFQKSRFLDAKTDALVAEIADVDWTPLDNEADALFLEAEMVRRYQPRYNILLRDDKSQLFVRIDYKSSYPTVTFIRRPLDDGAEYFGPYLNGFAVKKALRYLRKGFPYAVSRPVNAKRASLHYHLGLDPGLEEGRTTLRDYRANLRKLMKYLRGERVALVKAIEKDMKRAAAAAEFEEAATLRNQLFALGQLNRQVLFSDRENLDLSRDEALAGLTRLLNLPSPPRRLEAYDISHMQGGDTTASLVVFTNGATEKAAYRKFKMRTPGNDDFAHMSEVISRRFSPRNSSKWPKPQLILIDGGKGQLRAALTARDESGFSDIPVIGLAKRFEEIIIHKQRSLMRFRADLAVRFARSAGGYTKESEEFLVVVLPTSSALVKFLQRVRDESHRFAVSYHSTLKRKRQTASLLDDIPGIGPVTRKKLIRHFGSARAVLLARPEQLAEAVGTKRGQAIYHHLKTYR
jgi:excinuclease ABC subunit C